jgi:hypothetical protein
VAGLFIIMVCVVRSLESNTEGNAYASTETAEVSGDGRVASAVVVLNSTAVQARATEDVEGNDVTEHPLTTNNYTTTDGSEGCFVSSTAIFLRRLVFDLQALVARERSYVEAIHSLAGQVETEFRCEEDTAELYAVLAVSSEANTELSALVVSYFALIEERARLSEGAEQVCFDSILLLGLSAECTGGHSYRQKGAFHNQFVLIVIDEMQINCLIFI